MSWEEVEEEVDREEVRRVFLPLRPASALSHLLGPSADCHSNGVRVRERELCWTNSSFTSSPHFTSDTGYARNAMACITRKMYTSYIQGGIISLKVIQRQCSVFGVRERALATQL